MTRTNPIRVAVAAVVVAAGVVGCADSAKEKEKAAEAVAATTARAAADEKGATTGAASVGGVEGTRVAAFVGGVAGGVVEETVTAEAVVRGVDVAKRRVTLEGAGGARAEVFAPAEVRNLDQIKVGDRVTATLAQRLVVYVDRDKGAEPSAAYAAAVARAPKGAMPGAIAAHGAEVVAKVSAIDKAARRATLEFSDGQKRGVSVRPDVDLERYRVGDLVVIRISEELRVLVERS